MDRMIKVALMLTAVDRMSAVVNGAVNKSISGLNTLKSKADSVSKSAFAFGRDAGAAGLAVGAPIVGMLKAAADMEKMQVALKTSFRGNEQAAADAFQTINKFAATTPFELEEVMRGFVKLKNMGLDPSINALTSYGNTASSMGYDLNKMVEAVADAATGEFERLKDFGIRASSEGDRVTFLFQGVSTTVKKNAADIEKYLIGIGNTKFAGATIAQSKTVIGQFSTLKDNVRMLAANVGAKLIPAFTQLVEKITPIIEKVQAWVDKNPELTKRIVMVTAAASALLLGLSALGFIIGGVAQAVSIGATVFLNLVKALKFVGQAVVWLGRLFLTNPILLAITAIAVGVYLIIRHWDKIKAWFSRLWENIKRIFRSFIQFIAGFMMAVHPAGIIYRHWDKIVAFFVSLWGKIKAIFQGVVNWILGIGPMFFNAGKNVITSIWKGMKAVAMKPVEVVKDIAKKIREYLPFSPAKVGPLRDIHRIKLIETIADGIKPNSLVNAVRRTAQMAFNVIPQVAGQGAALPAFAGGGSRVNLNYSPSINMGGGGAGGGVDMRALLNEHAQHITRLVTEQLARRERTKFN